MNKGNIIFIYLVVSSFLIFSGSVYAADVSGSIIQASPSDIYEFQITTIKVTSKNGAGTALGGVKVNISAEEGSFVENEMKYIILTTDTNGVASADWKAPEAKSAIEEKEVTLTAVFTSGSDTSTKELNVTVYPLSFDESTITVDPDPVYETQNSTIEITAKGTYGTIAEASVHLTCDDGIFPDSDTFEIDVQTGSDGKVQVIWNADLTTLVSELNYVNFTASITYSGSTATKDLTGTIHVNELDLSSSTMTASSTDVGGGAHVSIVVTAEGALGVISNAKVELDALDGHFANDGKDITGYTNSSGKFETEWIAPDVSNAIDIILSGTVSVDNTLATEELDEITITVNPVVHNFTIDLVANASEVIAGEPVELTVTLTNELGDAVEEAEITFNAMEGEFVGFDAITAKINTSSEGIASVIWNTTDLSPPIPNGQDYPITISIVKEYYNSKEDSIDIHVNPVILKLSSITTPDKTTITQGENVTFIVYVSAGDKGVEGATVTITALAGSFASSGNQIASLETNSTGYVTFVWMTKDMTVTTAKNYNFTISSALPGYDSSEQETVTILVNPVSTGGTEPIQTNTPIGGLSTMTKLGILLGALGGVVLLGGLGYFLISRRGV
ncbi:MAG: hypothetical protein ACTSXD_10455 [Candidatus Heimdallarchaeaceae archaeon]